MERILCVFPVPINDGSKSHMAGEQRCTSLRQQTFYQVSVNNMYAMANDVRR